MSIRPRIVSKSFTYGQYRSQEFLWDNAYTPEVTVKPAGNNKNVAVVSFTSTPPAVGGHAIDLFIDRSTLLDMAIEYYGVEDLMLELGTRWTLTNASASAEEASARLQRSKRKDLEAENAELREKLEQYTKMRALTGGVVG